MPNLENFTVRVGSIKKGIAIFVTHENESKKRFFLTGKISYKGLIFSKDEKYFFPFSS